MFNCTAYLQKWHWNMCVYSHAVFDISFRVNELIIFEKRWDYSHYCVHWPRPSYSSRIRMVPIAFATITRRPRSTGLSWAIGAAGRGHSSRAQFSWALPSRWNAPRECTRPSMWLGWAIISIFMASPVLTIRCLRRHLKRFTIRANYSAIGTSSLAIMIGPSVSISMGLMRATAGHKFSYRGHNLFFQLNIEALVVKFRVQFRLICHLSHDDATQLYSTARNRNDGWRLTCFTLSIVICRMAYHNVLSWLTRPS